MRRANVIFRRVLRDGNVCVNLIATVDARTEEEARAKARADIRAWLPMDSLFADRAWAADEEDENAEVKWLADPIRQLKIVGGAEEASNSKYRIIGPGGKAIYEGDMEGVALYAQNMTVDDLGLLEHLGHALEHVQVALEENPDNFRLRNALSAIEDAYTGELDSDDDKDEDE